MASAVARLRGFAGAGALRRSAARAAPFATAAAAPPAGKVSRFALECADVTKAAAFFSDAAGLRLAPNASPARAVAGDGLGLSCDLVLLGGGSKRGPANAAAAAALDALDAGESEEEPLIHPFLTICVSNLKTAARHAKRQFGSVVRDPRPLPGTGAGGVPAQAAVFADPDGRRLRALHVFRRTPLAAVTLGVADVPASAEAYARVFGLRRVDEPAEAAEAHPRPGVPCAVLAFGPAHATTSLVLEPASAAPPAGRPPVHGDGADADDAPVPPVVELAVGDVGTSYHLAVGAGWAVSPFDEAADRGFTCADPDGNTFYVSRMAA